jgi:ABC-2 type transport system permease protein
MADSGTAASMLRMQVLVEQRIFWRNRSSTFFTFVLPLALLLVLGFSEDPVANLPAIVALGILSTSFQGLSIQLAMHRDQGVLKRIMATPLPPTVLVAGKVLSAMLVIAIETIVIVAVGVLAFGAPFPHHPLLLLLFVLLGTATFVALGFALASIIPSSDSAPAIVNGAYLALILVTALLHGIEGLPNAVRALGEVLPLGNLFVPLQHAWVGGWEPGNWWSALVLGGWTFVAALWTVRRFRWEPAFEG